MDYKETIKERIKILPDELKSFVLEEEWRKDAQKIGSEFGLDEEKYTALENEVFLTLLCFEPRKDFIENIKKELGVETADATWIYEDVEKKIFSKVSDELESIENFFNKNEELNQPTSNVGQDFEEIILNQARAMQPARNALASEAGGPAQNGIRRENQIPENLPVEKTPSIKTPDYSKSDPYREPLE